MTTKSTPGGSFTEGDLIGIGEPFVMQTATTTVAGSSCTPITSYRTFQAVVTGTGAVSATVQIQVSNDNVNWLLAGTCSPSGTTSAIDGFVSTAPWVYVRSNVTAISGTSAQVVVTLGV